MNRFSATRSWPVEAPWFLLHMRHDHYKKRLELIRPTNLPDAVTQATSQQRSQGDAIGIPDLRRDLVDTLVPRFQEVYRTLHPQTLKIGQGRPAQHRVHAARQRSLAGCD